MSSLEFRTFSSNWPHIVRIKNEKKKEHEAWLWIQKYCWDRDISCNEVFTSFSEIEFGFKDPKIAMEFKLRFG